MECSRGKISLGKTLCEHREKCACVLLIFLNFLNRCVLGVFIAEIGFG